VPPKRLHPETGEKLLAYAWPGNVRELQNEIERIVVLSGRAEVILPTVLSERIRSPLNVSSPGMPLNGSLEAAVEILERDLIVNGLRRHRWNKSRLARELAVSRTSLLQKIEKYGIERRRRPR
jgi:transcriptional regulator with PAS, ATPase and Fis domain